MGRQGDVFTADDDEVVKSLSIAKLGRKCL